MNNSIRKTLTLLTIVFLFSYLFSTEFLSWEEILKEAKEKNPQLKQAELNLKQVKFKLEKAKGEFYPQVSLGSSVGKTYEKDFESEINYSYNLSLGMNLFSGFSKINNLRLQIVELQIMQENYRRVLADLIAELKKNFINLYYSQEMINLAEKILKRRRQNYELIKLKYESGREDLGAFLRVEADMLQADYELKKAKRSYETALRSLLKTIGREDFIEFKVKANFELSKIINEFLNKKVEELVADIPEYKIKQYRLKEAILKAKITKAEFYPMISVSAGYILADTEPMPNTERWNVSLGLRINYNIFNGFKNLNDLKIANVNIKTAELDLYDTKLSLQNNWYILKNNFIDLKESLEVKEKYLKALEKQAEIISVKYVNGLATYYDWYQTEDSFINSQKSLLSLKKELIIAEIDLKKFLGLTE